MPLRTREHSYLWHLAGGLRYLLTRNLLPKVNTSSESVLVRLGERNWVSGSHRSLWSKPLFTRTYTRGGDLVRSVCCGGNGISRGGVRRRFTGASRRSATTGWSRPPSPRLVSLRVEYDSMRTRASDASSRAGCQIHVLLRLEFELFNSGADFAVAPVIQSFSSRLFIFHFALNVRSLFEHARLDSLQNWAI